MTKINIQDAIMFQVPMTKLCFVLHFIIKYLYLCKSKIAFGQSLWNPFAFSFLEGFKGIWAKTDVWKYYSENAI